MYRLKGGGSMTEKWNALTDSLVKSLQRETYILTVTMHAEKQTPYLHTASWVYAKDARTIRIAIDAESQIIKNLKQRSYLMLAVMEEGSTYAIEGKGVLITEEMEGLPIQLALVECQVEEVEDIMFDGGKLTTPPHFEKTYDIEAAAKLDKQVMNALQQG
ncbi:hypothetical protein GJS40_13660 [Aliibacillus thermotolerans]|nr:hypothetical protein [Aliibacillus thermotolerans]